MKKEDLAPVLLALSIMPFGLIANDRDLNTLGQSLHDAKSKKLTSIEFSKNPDSSKLMVFLEDLSFIFQIKGLDLVFYKATKGNFIQASRYLSTSEEYNLFYGEDDLESKSQVQDFLESNFDSITIQESNDISNSVIVVENGVSSSIGSFDTLKMFKDFSKVFAYTFDQLS